MSVNNTIKRGLIGGVGVIAVAALSLGGYIGWIQYNGNFDTVIAGQVYRSAQPSAADIKQYAAAHGIKSIINLKGADPGQAWYDNEVQASAQLGITHYDFGMSAYDVLPQPKAQELVDLMARAEKPVLIHCNWGKDRTGLASALYVAKIANLGEKKAESQISIRYGHFSLPITQTYAMDVSFENLEPWLGIPKS